MSDVVIVDYGMGNLRSVQKALEHMGATAEISDDPKSIRRASKVVLPGVGAFADAAAALRARGLDRALVEHARADKPLLGVCLGLQLLFECSQEDGRHEGLGLLRGEVVRFPADMTDPEGRRLKVPHMGWNAVRATRSDPILEGIGDGAYFYFVHAYHAVPADPGVVLLEAEHGVRFCAMVGRDNLYATQFHPEKSQRDGLRLYENFLRL